jgi:hypothetical protein
MAGNAEYVVEVAAHMTGDETLDELDRLSSELTTAGVNASEMQKTVQGVGRELRAGAGAGAPAAASLLYKKKRTKYK